MRFVTLFTILFAWISQLHAQLYANFTTNLGTFKVELFHKETPRTVGNFVSLAEGTRRWVDERTGIVSTTKPLQPFYTNMPFHRIINDSGFKIAQVGSKKGDGTDGPGYTFPDEMRESVPLSYKFDQPYLLAMANSGPNTNGSQFFLTGSTIPHLEGKHTVFGKCIEGTAIIDAILAQATGATPPNQAVTITNITMQRVGENARRFRATQQHLPVVTTPHYRVIPAPAENGRPAPTNTNRYLFTQPQRTEFRCYVSRTDLVNEWKLETPRWIGSPFIARYFDFSYSTRPISQFRPVLVRYDSRDALCPGTIAGYSLRVEDALGVHVYRIPFGATATYTSTPPGANPVVVNGTITSGETLLQPHTGKILLALNNGKQVLLSVAFDKRDKMVLTGRCTSELRPNANSLFTQAGGDQGFTMTPIR